MADKQLAAVGGLLFCGLVLLLLLILYFPNTDDDEDDQVVTTKSWNDFKSNAEVSETEPKIVVAARIIEDMGVSFLVLLAVVCAAAGLACLVWACCCLA